METLLTLQDVFREVFDSPKLEITASTTLEEIDGWDSTEAVKLLLTIESEFDVEFPPDMLADIKSVGDIINLVEKNS